MVLRQWLLLEELHVIQQSPAAIRRAVELKAAYQISFWDACIIATAAQTKCRVILSEDMNAGQFLLRHHDAKSFYLGDCESQ